jgi:hypothetical protein
VTYKGQFVHFLLLSPPAWIDVSPANVQTFSFWFLDLDILEALHLCVFFSQMRLK